MAVSNDKSNMTTSQQLKEILEGFEKKLDERLARFDVALSTLDAHITHRVEAQAAATKRREAAAVRKAAAIAAQESRPFDPANVYGTLVNPRGRVKDVLLEFVTAAASEYKELEETQAVLQLFLSDFKHWDESHFRALPKKDTAKLREVLVEKQVSIRGGRFPAFRALSQIIRNANRNAATNANNENNTDNVNQNEKTEDVGVNGVNKVNTVSSPMSPPTKEQRTGNTSVAM